MGLKSKKGITGLGALALAALLFPTSSSDDAPTNTIVSTEIDSAYVDTEIIDTETYSEIETEVSIVLETEVDSELTNILETETMYASEVEPETVISEPISEETIQQTASSEKEEVLVWVDDTASRYHKKNGCGMDNAYQVTLEEAEEMGKTPCGRCYK